MGVVFASGLGAQPFEVKMDKFTLTLLYVWETPALFVSSFVPGRR